MNTDLLLTWASECGSGTWQQFRDAHQWISAAYPGPGDWEPSAGYAARTLTTLAHLEIDWQNGRWAAAPPVLTLLPSAGAHALLTGARTRTLTDHLRSVTDDDPALFVAECPQRHAPTALLIACEDETSIEMLAAELDVGYEFSVSERLSEMLPTLDSYLALARAMPAPSGYGVSRLQLSTLTWLDADSDRDPCLYRYDAFGRPRYRLVVGDAEVYDVDLAVGVWAALSRWGENRLIYTDDPVNGTLNVPTEAPLPTLHARSAALCSGLAPGRRDGFLAYRNVPRPVAERIARSLDQTLVTSD